MDEPDFGTQLENALSKVALFLGSVARTPLLIADLLRAERLKLIASAKWTERRYPGPQTILVLAYLLWIAESLLPDRFGDRERLILTPGLLEREQYHYVLELFVWFLAFTIIRKIARLVSKLPQHEATVYERLLGYLMVLPLLWMSLEEIVEIILVYLGKEQPGGIWSPKTNNFAIAAIILPRLLLGLVYPLIVLTKMSRVGLFKKATGDLRKDPLRWPIWRTLSGTMAVIMLIEFVEWSPAQVRKMEPPPVGIEILDMSAPLSGGVLEEWPLSMHILITNRTGDDTFVDLAGLSIVEMRHGLVQLSSPDPATNYLKVAKDSAEMVFIQRTVKAKQRTYGEWQVRGETTRAQGRSPKLESEVFNYELGNDD